ncbi:hypothetical protein E2C00_16670 [Streptomyces sp. WAC05374]|uniref:hypothetical protein n=1 Tax=Streptomyces sp. WAC05374 TaxID=2487420 RepID=UPI000F87B1BD|nr:hypothetical protein [Streptomyces sp. WAC05374]RST13001.1 hypothetical protein EF905_21250 [Streptomyces sp. WAC05374]TDF54562.1 hypothetical protein E2C00_16670 [Streptomyces sp. WAC05374]TDF56197.1 hypothetical protein E2C02_12125 [Streptomyces sp. WAC05374]
MYPGLDFGREELSAVMRRTYDELIEFVTTPEFQAVHDELMELQESERPEFVQRVLLDPEELRSRGVMVPSGILIQMSAFGDRRPTLYAVKKFLPEKYHRAWENVNLTFNNSYDESAIPSDAEASWRAPLPVALQNELIAQKVDLRVVPSEFEKKDIHRSPTVQ